MWRKGKPFSESEKRLLSTFTGQGALALERARLVESESRSRVLEESDRLKSALLSSVSHELRTPLATIKASISSLRSDTLDLGADARRDLLAAIEEETDQLNQLVGNILDMSRIETGSLDPQRKWNSLAEIATGVLDRMRQVLQHHRIRLDIPPDFSLLPVDYVLMEQVFSNLLSNSAKYAPPGTEIIIQARLNPDQTALVQVINQGPPVAEENLNRIFDKFYRVTAADKITGTGLGLSICKGIVEAHGGRIWAENAPGQFIFFFTLPLAWHGSLPQIPMEE
jgi:two-component system sensor histidine kinase KdpD